VIRRIQKSRGVLKEFVIDFDANFQYLGLRILLNDTQPPQIFFGPSCLALDHTFQNSDTKGIRAFVVRHGNAPTIAMLVLPMGTA
jgi:hypothetical protein